MALEPIQNIKTNSPANQPEFKQLIIPGMEELSKKLTPNLNSHLVPPHTPPGIQIPG
jgi:hypothetical protein